jgi:DNA replication and repair protein RecF
MYLKDFIIQLQEFSEANFEFDGKIICFVGKTVSENECTWCYLSFILRQSYFNPLAVKTLNTVKSFFVDDEFIKWEKRTGSL